ncbi:MAG: SOS response-associated peptidase [Longimicrobiales bacterium]
MCGRYTLSVPLSNLVDAFEVSPPEFDYRPRYNIAPTQEAPVIAQDERGKRMGLLRWGLIPSWAKDPGMGSRLINARSETVAQKPAFRSALRHRRCLIPADGFYEWRKVGEGKGGKGSKTPFWIHRAGREPFAFAGLWERWQPGDGPPLFTFTILTTEAAAEIRHIHPRMPVILPPGTRSDWLDLDSDPVTLLDSLRDAPGVPLQAHPVSSLVNSPGNDLPACIEKIDPSTRSG